MRRLINQLPGRPERLALGILPFLLLLCVYVIASQLRLAENPDDKLLPAPAAFIETLKTYAVEEDRRSGEVLWWLDTGASLKRLLIALAISATIGILAGLAIGSIPYIRSFMGPFVCRVPLGK